MATLLNKIPTNLTEYPNSFKRQGAFPLEAYSVFYDIKNADDTTIVSSALDNAKEYAKNNPIAYVGQVIAVVDSTNNNVPIYVIENTNGDLKLLSTINDLNSLDSKLSGLLNELTQNFNTLKGTTNTTLTELEAIVTKGIEDINNQHTKDVESINSSLEEIHKEITSKVHFSTQLIDAVNTSTNTVKLKNATTFTSASYGIIYLLPITNAVGEDKYQEYILVQTVENPKTYSLILTGTTSTDLSNYVLTEDLEKYYFNKTYISENYSTNSQLNMVIPFNDALNEVEDFTKQYLTAFEEDGKVKVVTLDLSDYVTSNYLTTNYPTRNLLTTNYSDNKAIELLLNIQSQLKSITNYDEQYLFNFDSSHNLKISNINLNNYVDKNSIQTLLNMQSNLEALESDKYYLLVKNQKEVNFNELVLDAGELH